MGWEYLIGALAALTLFGAYLSRRTGRGSYEITSRYPTNETQTTTPKMWP